MEKPPITIQIFFALAFLGLLAGVFTAVMSLMEAGSSSYLVGQKISAGVMSYAVFIAYAFIVALLFYLALGIRRGSLAKLKVYTGLYGLVLVSAAISMASLSERKMQVSGASWLEIIALVPCAILIGIMWLKERTYFK